MFRTKFSSYSQPSHSGFSYWKCMRHLIIHLKTTNWVLNFNWWWWWWWWWRWWWWCNNNNNNNNNNKAMRHITAARRTLTQGDTPIFTTQQPTLALKDWLSNVDNPVDHQWRIINMSENPCQRNPTINCATTGPKKLTELPIATDQLQLCFTKPPKKHTQWL
jgi:hypothetical protein